MLRNSIPQDQRECLYLVYISAAILTKRSKPLSIKIDHDGSQLPLCVSWESDYSVLIFFLLFTAAHSCLDSMQNMWPYVFIYLFIRLFCANLILACDPKLHLHSSITMIYTSNMVNSLFKTICWIIHITLSWFVNKKKEKKHQVVDRSLSLSHR